MPSCARTIITIPVKNEEARIGPCLNALYRQTASVDRIMLLLNNCTDDTLAICEQFSRQANNIEVLQVALHGNLASAGEARRLVLNHAAATIGDGIILTTDADAVPDANWVAKNLLVLANGADVVCGMAILDHQDALTLPRTLRIDEENETLLTALLDEIGAIVAPTPYDPWPRHQHHSGASLAMRATILRKAGGAPHVATGEDRALIERLRLIDAKIRHAPEISVRVSGRLDGRAEGGMAATLQRRIAQRDVLTDERLEPTVDAYRRALAKRHFRAVFLGHADAAPLAEDLLIGAGTMRHALQTMYFGAAWADVQRLSPVLQRRRVAFTDIRREIQQAALLRDQLRQFSVAMSPVHPNHKANLASD